VIYLPPGLNTPAISPPKFVSPRLDPANFKKPNNSKIWFARAIWKKLNPGFIYKFLPSQNPQTSNRLNIARLEVVLYENIYMFLFAQNAVIVKSPAYQVKMYTPNSQFGLNICPWRVRYFFGYIFCCRFVRPLKFFPYTIISQGQYSLIFFVTKAVPCSLRHYFFA
jgi:hypothetical protein